MSQAQPAKVKALPSRPNLSYLKKLSKERLKSLRGRDASTKLADAQLAVAREFGFASWRKLKAHVDAALTFNVSHASHDLMKAIVRHDLSVVRQMLAEHPLLANISAPHPHWGGRPMPLHVAVESGDLSIVRALLHADADPSAAGKEYDRWSPLMLAIHWKQSRMRDALLKCKANVGLIEALMLADDRAVKRILRSDPKALSGPFPNDATPLHFARTVAAVRLLINAGFDPRAKDKYGATALDGIARLGPQGKPVLGALADSAASVSPITLAGVGDIASLRRQWKENPAIVHDPAVLESAVGQGLFFVVRWLLDHGADVNARSPRGSRGTILHTAAWEGHLPVTRLLVEHGAKIDAIDEEHHSTPAVLARTALERFGRRPCKAVAEYLEAVEQSRQPNATKPPPRKSSAAWKPIMDAAFHGNAKAVRSLIASGADPNVVSTTVQHYRPLHRAIEAKKLTPRGPGHEEVVRLLLKASADPKMRGTWSKLTALQLAAMQSPQFVPILIEHVKDLDIFHAAALADDRRVAALLKHDPKLAQARDENDMMPLSYCAGSAMFKVSEHHKQSLAKIAQMLLDAGADPNATIHQNETAPWPLPVLYFCCGRHDNPAVAEVLFMAGGKPCDNETVYHAVDEQHQQCLALIEKYCDPKLLAAECTKVLAYQLHYGRTRGAPWLLAHGADPNDFTQWGESSLHSAVRNSSNDKIVRLLLAHGAKASLKNKDGQTPLELARSLKRTRIQNLLESS